MIHIVPIKQAGISPACFVKLSFALIFSGVSIWLTPELFYSLLGCGYEYSSGPGGISGGIDCPNPIVIVGGA